MSSTRNKNTPGNYKLEQRSLDQHADYITHIQSVKAAQTHFPGSGLLTGLHAPSELSRNSCDIESFLYGIGTTNLVETYQRPVAEIRKLQSLDMIDRIPMIIPEPLAVTQNQRPRPLP